MKPVIYTLNIIRLVLKSKKIMAKIINDCLLCFNKGKYMYFSSIFNLNDILCFEGFA